MQNLCFSMMVGPLFLWVSTFWYPKGWAAFLHDFHGRQQSLCIFLWVLSSVVYMIFASFWYKRDEMPLKTVGKFLVCAFVGSLPVGWLLQPFAYGAPASWAGFWNTFLPAFASMILSAYGISLVEWDQTPPDRNNAKQRYK